MFDCTTVGAGSAGGTVADHLAKGNNKSNPKIIATKGKESP